MSGHGLAAEIDMADRRTGTALPRPGTIVVPQSYGLTSDLDKGPPMPPGPRHGSAGGYGIGAEITADSKQRDKKGDYGIEADYAGSKPGPAPQGSDFPGFGLAEEAKRAGQMLAGQQTASRVATSQLDHQADVMTRRGAAAPMVRGWEVLAFNLNYLFEMLGLLTCFNPAAYLCCSRAGGVSSISSFQNRLVTSFIPHIPRSPRMRQPLAFNHPLGGITSGRKWSRRVSPYS